MDGLFTRIGSAVFANKADKQMKSLSKDVDNLATSASEGARYFVNKLRGTMQVPIHDVLEKYGLPKGIIPKEILSYTFDEATGEITVKLAENCEVKFSDGCINRYAKEISGTLKQGSFLVKQGIKTKLVFWLVVTAITADNPEEKKTPQVYFATGRISKGRPLPVYQTPRTPVAVEDF